MKIRNVVLPLLSAIALLATGQQAVAAPTPKTRVVLTHHDSAQGIAAEKKIKKPHPYAESHRKPQAPRGVAAARQLSVTSTQSYGSGDESVARAAAEDFGLDECRDQYYKQPNPTEKDFWWIKNHFIACSTDDGWSIDTVQEKNGEAEIVGQIFFRVTGVIEGSKGTRKLTNHYEFDEWDDWGLAAWEEPIDFDLDCTFSSGVRCPEVNQKGRRDTVTNFRRTGKTDITIDFNNITTGEGADKLSFYEINPELYLVSKPLDPELVMPKLDVRCDWANYEDNGGCIFHNVRAHWEGLSLSDPDVDEVAHHVKDAFDDITKTKPGVPGTYVPGNFNNTDRLHGGAPLTRSRSQKLNDDNRTAAVKACKAAFGPGYSEGQTKDCDEYPMAATNQGTTSVNLETNPRSFSVRPLDLYDNRRAGSRWKVWAGQDHILDNDPFWINIKP